MNTLNTNTFRQNRVPMKVVALIVALLFIVSTIVVSFSPFIQNAFAAGGTTDPTLVAPTDGSTSTSATVTVSWDSPADLTNVVNYRVNYKKPASSGPGYATIPVGTNQYTFPGLENSDWEIWVEAIDASNNVLGASAHSTITVNGPVVTNISPSPDSTVVTRQPVFEWQDNSGASVDRYRVQLSRQNSNGSTTAVFTESVPVADCTAGSCSLDKLIQDSTLLDDQQEYVWEIRSVNSGFEVIATTPTMKFTVNTDDVTVPDHTVMGSATPGDNSTWNGPITIAGTSEDDAGANSSGIDYVTIYIKKSGEPDSAYVVVKTVANTNNDQPFNWTTTYLPSADGTYDFMIKATDNNGNTENTAYALNVTYTSSAAGGVDTPPGVPNTGSSRGFNP